MAMTGHTEFGGYLPLELPTARGEYYVSDSRMTVIDLDCGRSALLYALDFLRAKRVLCPLYYCPSVKRLLEKLGYEVIYYPLLNDLFPMFDNIEVSEGDVVILVNFFGIMEHSITRYASQFDKVIIDNCLAFYAKPLIQSGAVNIYSCRKFFGVSDGAYAVGIDLPEPSYPQDVSSGRAGYLLDSLELGTNAGYLSSLDNERSLGRVPKRMSRLTHEILSTIDYASVMIKRSENYRALHLYLSDLQTIDVPCDAVTAHSYPLLPNRMLRQELVSHRVYVARYWEDWIGVACSNEPQWIYSNYVLCLPIDQRYNVDDMNRLSDIVHSVYEGCSQ